MMGSQMTQFAVCEIRRRVSGNESVEPTDEFRYGELFGKNNVGVRASRFVPLFGELEESLWLKVRIARSWLVAKANCASLEQPKFPASRVVRQSIPRV
jgi:hypothetical protein